MISQKRRKGCVDNGKRDLPSVIAFQPKYKTPTAAVSSKVATKEPSTFEPEPYKGRKKKKSQQSRVR